MKSTRRVATVAVVVTSLLAACVRRGVRREQLEPDDGHDQRRIADPGQHARSRQAVQQPGRAVREGQPVDQGQAGRVPVDRADVRREARRRDAADRVRGAVHRRADARRQRPARRPDRRGQGAAVLLEVQPGGPRRGHRRRRARSSRCRRAPTRRPCTTTASCSRRRASTRTSRRRRGRRSARTRSRSPRRPARPATSQMAQGRQHRRLDPDDA